MSDVKRFFIPVETEAFTAGQTAGSQCVEVVHAVAHDRIVAKQRRVIEALKKQRDRKGCSYCEPPDDTRSDADEKEIAALEKEQS